MRLCSIISLLFLLHWTSVSSSYWDSDESQEAFGHRRRTSYPQRHHHRQEHQRRYNHRPSPSSRSHHRFAEGFSNFASFSPYVSSPQVRPPYSLFAASPNHVASETPRQYSSRVTPGHLTLHQKTLIKSGRHHSPQVSPRPRHPFTSAPILSHGFSPARTYTSARPVILEPHQNKHFNNFVEPYGKDNGCSHSSSCWPVVICAPEFEVIRKENLGCSFNDGSGGACCPKPVERRKRRSLFGPLSINVQIRAFSLNEINEAASEALVAITEREDIETNLIRQNVVLTNRNRPAYGHLQFFKTSPQAQGIGRDGLIHRFTCESLIRRFNLSPIEASFGLQKVTPRNSIIDNTCPPMPECGKKETFYRTIDGSCNNQKNPKYGQARTPFQRILPPQYGDGHHEPRKSVRGHALPSARVVSLTNVADAHRPNSELSLFVMQWGQFIDHDLTHTPIFRFDNQTGIECCDDRGQLVPSLLSHPACLPIEIPADDPFHSPYGRRCMNFVRSMPAPRDDCNLGFVEQMNQVSHFLDGSAVYGSSASEEEELRSFRGGLLKVQEHRLLPADRNASEEDCHLVGTSHNCFLAGDNRVNEQPDLTIIHTLWVRQHNRLAKELARLNPHWTDETVFQETRRIVAAQIQHIVYNEWLPLILGTNDVEINDLVPLREGFFGGYDHLLDATILNEFATVAFRFGHTLVEGMLRLYDKGHRHTETINLFEHFNSPRLLYEKTKFDQLIRGLFKQPMQSFDNFVADDLTNRLFQTEQMPFGMDLIALNVQRGRDHGIPSYNDLREVCGIPRARTFDDLRDFLDPETINILKSLYASVDDIDPFVAGISEVPVNGGVVGPTFNCIIKDQFSRLKLGDRFFYENGGMKSSFTEAQLHEIRMTSWARIVCETSDHINHIQPLAMRLPGSNNEKVSCDSSAIPTLDLTPWISAP